MSNDFTQTLTKMQGEALELVKKAQDANVESLRQVREMVGQIPTTMQVPSLESLPSVTKSIELGFEFAGKFLELRKAYALQLAEIFTAAQKEATEATVRVAKAATASVN